MSTLNADIQNAIDSNDIERARTLLRDALPSADAETYYLASLVALNEGQKADFLKKALELDPFHVKANTEKAKLKPQHAAPASSGNMEQVLARQRSFIGPAIVTFVLTWLFWLPGLIANLLFLSEARKVQARAGEKLSGVGCLWALLIVNGIIPLILLIVFLRATLGTYIVFDNRSACVVEPFVYDIANVNYITVGETVNPGQSLGIQVRGGSSYRVYYISEDARCEGPGTLPVDTSLLGGETRLVIEGTSIRRVE
jgi:hypothetical protein